MANRFTYGPVEFELTMSEWYQFDEDAYFVGLDYPGIYFIALQKAKAFHTYDGMDIRKNVGYSLPTKSQLFISSSLVYVGMSTENMMERLSRHAKGNGDIQLAALIQNGYSLVFAHSPITTPQQADCGEYQLLDTYKLKAMFAFKKKYPDVSLDEFDVEKFLPYANQNSEDCSSSMKLSKASDIIFPLMKSH